MKPQWYFFYFFLFFWSFIFPVGQERNGNTIFIFALSRPFANFFGLKRSQNWVFLFFEFFYNFFLIISYASCRNETKRLFLFSLFFGLFQPVLACNEAVMVFLTFQNFFAIFFEFSITRRVGTERNETIIFIFSLCPPFPTYFGLKRSHNSVF